MLSEVISQYLEEKRTNLLGESGKFHVSDAGRCHLYRFWKRKMVPPTDLPGRDVLGIFEAGNIFHHKIQDILAEKGMLVAREREVEDTHRKGRIDAIVVGNDGKKILYDIKTVQHSKFGYVDIDKHYCMQAYTYKTMLDEDIDDVMILYVSRHDFKTKDVSVYELKDIDSITKRDWEELLKVWEEGKEPRPNPSEWECRYCMYRTRCQPTEKKKKEVAVISDQELEALLERRAELIELVKEYETIENTIKEKSKELPQSIVIGRWILEKKPVKRTMYEVPEEIKQQYKIVREYEKLIIDEL